VETWSLNNVDLVVLSACETGVGGLGNGEEILGLGYQFQLSGAKSVMASLWAVSDDGTQQLMTEFYAALSQGGMTKAEALQQAQLSLLYGQDTETRRGEVRASIEVETVDGTPLNNVQGLQHPYYWAPFILIGNGL
ncbi:MAG: CHAT domain-containing protein, partial [Cyanobacteria bacterium J06632_22]